MNTSKVRLWLGPLFVLIVFGLFNLKQKVVQDHKIEQMDKALGFTLKETSKELNLKHIHHKNIVHKNFSRISKWFEFLGASVTVADFNNDGFQDVFLNDSSPKNEHALFINNRHGQFENKTHQFKMDQMSFPYPPTKIVAFDCNNDGYQDLFVLSNCPQLLINHKGEYFEDFTAQSGLKGKCSAYGFAANVFDYDKDGNLDIIWGSYLANDFMFQGENLPGILPDNFLDSKNDAKIFFMKGDGGCHFSDKSNLIPKSKLHGWFFDIGVLDIFKNGNQDLWIASDYGINNLLRFESVTTGWKDESNLVDKPSISRTNMGVIFSDVDHQKTSSTFITSIFQHREKVYGNLLFDYNKISNEFQERGHDSNISSCGWAWGSQFIDLNNDSWDDLVVVNGLFGDGTKKSYWYNLSVLDAAGRKYMGDIKNWPSTDNFDLDGGQRDCIFLNQKDKKPFMDVTNSTVFDLDRKNGRGIAYIDVNNDGIYSLIVANQNDVSHVYQVTPTNPYKWIGLSLSGFKNNSFAYGAKVFWKLSDGSESFKEMRPIQGFMSQNDPRFRLAFPPDLSITELSIIWLDGEKQILDLKSLKMNQYNPIVKRH